MSHHGTHKIVQTKSKNGRAGTPGHPGDIVNYNVLNCRPVINSSSPVTAPKGKPTHLQVLLQIESGVKYWMTINISNGEDNVSYFASDDYQNPITEAILNEDLPEGFTDLSGRQGGINLDYVKDDLFDFKNLVDLEEQKDGAHTPLSDILHAEISNAARFPDARMFVFGSRFDDKDGSQSPFGVATGIHDIHMNQGSVGAHAASLSGYYEACLTKVHRHKPQTGP